MQGLRVNTQAPSFSSAGSGSPGYFTPVCGLVEEGFRPKIDKHSLTSRVSRQDMEVFCKKKHRSGFVKRLGLAGKKLYCSGKHAVTPKKKQGGHSGKQAAQRSTSAATVVATPVTTERRDLLCSEQLFKQEESPGLDSQKEGESRGGHRVYGLGALLHEEQPTAGSVAKDTRKKTASQVTMSMEELQGMSGTWRLVKSTSGGIQQMCELMELGWVFRKSLENSDIIEIDINDERIVQTAKVFRLVDIVEEFPLTGEERSHRRRDLRRGCLYGKAKLTPSGYCTSSRWNDPCEGGMSETYSFAKDGRTMDISVHVWRANGGTCDFQTFWSRKI